MDDKEPLQSDGLECCCQLFDLTGEYNYNKSTNYTMSWQFSESLVLISYTTKHYVKFASPGLFLCF